MAKKINADHIEWAISLKTTEAQKALHDLEKSNRDLKTQQKDVKRSLLELEKANLKGSKSYKSLQNDLKGLNRQVNENNEKMKALRHTMDPSVMTISQLRKRLKELKSELHNTSKATDPERFAQLRQQISDTNNAISQMTSETEKSKSSFLGFSKIGETVKGALYSIGTFLMTYVVNGFKQFLTTIIDFEKANSRLAAVLGTTKAGIKDLTAEARRLGATTSYTAAQVTSLQIELAKLGFAKDQIKDMTPAVLKFAKAVDTDLGSAAAFAGASMRIFGKEASEVDEMLATLAIGTTKSALDFSFLQNAMSTVGPVAASFGFTVEETTALLGALANAGFDASTAATATRNILLNLADSNGKLAQAIGQPVNNLGDLVAGLQKLTAEGIDLNAALELTDKRSVAAFSSFLAGADTLTSLQASVTDCSDQFNAMSEEMGDNVSGALAILQSTVEGVVLKFYEARGPLKAIVDAMSAVVSWVGVLIDLIGRMSGLIITAAGAWAAYRAGLLLNVALKKVYYLWITRSTKATLLETAAIKGQSVLLSAYKGLILLVNAAKALMTGNILKAGAAMRTFNLVVKMNPLGLLLSVISAVIVAFDLFGDKADESAQKLEEAKKRTEEFRKSISDLSAGTKKYATEELANLDKLYNAATNQYKSTNRRIAAAKELQRLYPAYFANMSTEEIMVGKACIQYARLAKNIREVAKAKAAQELMKENEKEMLRLGIELGLEYDKITDLQDQIKKKNLQISEYEWKRDHSFGRRDLDPVIEQLKSERDAMRDELRSLIAPYNEKKTNYEAIKPVNDQLEKMYGDIDTSKFDVENDLGKPLGVVANTADDAATKLKKLNTEIKSLQKQLKDAKPGTDVKALAAKIKLLQSQRKELLGTEASKRTPGTYQDDSLKKVTAPIETEHLTRQQSIDDKKSSMTAGAYARATAEETKRYAQETIDALTKLRASTAESHDKTLDEIDMQLILWQGKITKAQADIDKSVRDEAERGHNERMKQLADGYKDQERTLNAAVSAGTKAREVADIELLAHSTSTHRQELAELQSYLSEVKGLNYDSADDREKAEQKVTDAIKSKQNEILTDTGHFMEKYRELIANDNSAESVEAEWQRRRMTVAAAYDAMIAMEGLSADQTVALQEAKNRALAQLDAERLVSLTEHQAQVSGSWADEYDHELAMLKESHAKGMIEEKDFQKKKLQLQMKNAMKYYSYFQNLAANTVGAMQEYEIAASDAKYDELIRQAENNGEDTAALEEEKENAKLEIQKKYADADFAVKVAQIIANTALAIMTAYGQLGPIAGSVAAAMLTATGAMQVAAANAERERIKNLQPKRTAKKSDVASSASATRQLTGYSEGGYTGDGARYEVAGVVHRGEYVIPKPIMSHPYVVDAVGNIEAIRRYRMSPLPPVSSGYADGGFTGDAADRVKEGPSSSLDLTLRELRKTAKAMRKPQRSYVVLKDIHRAESIVTAARNPFTRK